MCVCLTEHHKGRQDSQEEEGLGAVAALEQAVGAKKRGKGGAGGLSMPAPKGFAAVSSLATAGGIDTHGLFSANPAPKATRPATPDRGGHGLRATQTLDGLSATQRPHSGGRGPTEALAPHLLPGEEDTSKEERGEGVDDGLVGVSEQVAQLVRTARHCSTTMLTHTPLPLMPMPGSAGTSSSGPMRPAMSQRLQLPPWPQLSAPRAAPPRVDRDRNDKDGTDDGTAGWGVWGEAHPSERFATLRQNAGKGFDASEAAAELGRQAAQRLFTVDKANKHAKTNPAALSQPSRANEARANQGRAHGDVAEGRIPRPHEAGGLAAARAALQGAPLSVVAQYWRDNYSDLIQAHKVGAKAKKIDKGRGRGYDHFPSAIAPLLAGESSKDPGLPIV